ncbi:MAG: A24 family peptidase C-terminal domain-containing protein [Candidatus Bathyarchaeia archaeon]
MQTILGTARTALALSFLFYASYSDYKTREVRNKVWVFFAPTAFTLTFTELFLMFNFELLLLYGLCFGLTSAFAVALFYAGGFGGADAKALMCLALALPFHPNVFTPLLGEVSPTSQFFFPITVFSNSVLLAAATTVYMLLHNVFWHVKTGEKLFEENHQKESVWKKLVVLITGYKISVDKLKEKWHLYPLEDVEENAEGTFKRKLVVVPKDEGRNAIVERLAKAVENGKIQNKVWATPGLPMLIFMTAALILALFLGDLVWNFISFIFG